MRAAAVAESARCLGTRHPATVIRGGKRGVEMKIEAIEQHGPDRFYLHVSKMFPHTLVLAAAKTDQGVVVLFVLASGGSKTVWREPFRVGEHVGQPVRDRWRHYGQGAGGRVWSS